MIYTPGNHTCVSSIIYQSEDRHSVPVATKFHVLTNSYNFQCVSLLSLNKGQLLCAALKNLHNLGPTYLLRLVSHVPPHTVSSNNN